MKTGAFIVPTGIGASIGGYAGDAGVWAKKFAKKCTLLVNPNVVNAAGFSAITDNMLYVEGYTLDSFFKGECSLKQSSDNKIGVVFDKAIPQDVLNIHINTINAVKTVYGINIISSEITEEEIGVEFYINKTGDSTGRIKNINTIKKASNKLLKNGADAIAIVCLFPEDNLNEDYQKGIGVDPVGGIEAIISHYISKELKVPCAHAPAFKDFSISTNIVSPKSASEYITPTFLPCILLGLNNAPQIYKYNRKYLCVDDLDFIIMPYNSIGCIPVLEMAKRNKTIYCVKENKTILDVTGMNFMNKCVIIKTYSELLELI